MRTLGLFYRYCAPRGWFTISTVVAALIASLILCGLARAEEADQDLRTSQQLLQSLGYKPGPADGMMGARTRAALKKFQKDEGLPETGELDPATMRAFGFKDPAASEEAPANDAASNSDSASPGAVALVLALIVGGLIFAFIKTGGTKSAKTNWAPDPEPRSAPVFGKRTVPPPQKAGLDVYVSPVISPMPQQAAAIPRSAEHTDFSVSTPANPPLVGPPDTIPGTVADNTTIPTKQKLELSAETAQSIAEHNQRVTEAIAGLSFADPKKRIIAALAGRSPTTATENVAPVIRAPISPVKAEPKILLPAVESSPRPKPPGLGLNSEVAESIAEHNRSVAAAIKEQSLVQHNKDVSAWVATHAASHRPEIAPKRAETPPPAAEPVRTQLNMKASDHYWVPGSQAVRIGAFQIPSGMLYVGTKLRSQNGTNENCLIDPTQYVADSNADTAGQTMPYWPSYSSISPQCRLAYLQWLAGGKHDPSAYIGYVFLYFYGLERRLMLDDPGEEALKLIAEVERLLSVYGDNHSFRGYASKLIEAAKFKFDGATEEVVPALGRRESELPLSIRAGIGQRLADGKTISADWMLAWYAASPDRYLRTAATRCQEEFATLFRKRFVEKYPDGMKVTTPRRRLTYSYRAASATFLVSPQSQATNLPDIVALSAPLTAIEPLIQSCTDDLEPYSRLIGRDPESRNSVRGATLLPPDFDSTGLPPPLADLSAFLEKAAAAPAAMLDLDTLRAKLEIKTTEKGRIPRAALTMMSEALARCGFAIEPDPLSAGNVLNGADKVILFKASGGAKIDPDKPSYLAARALIDIGALVATADGVFSEDEVHAIESEVTRDPDLNAIERTRLLAYLAFLSKTPPSTRILSRFKGQPPEKRQALARLAIAVAGADGRLAPEEVKLLEKTYRTLGLADTSLYSDLQAFAASGDDMPTVIPADYEPSVAIPRPAAKTEPKTVHLDAARLAQTRNDTAKVSAILSAVFSDDQQDEPTPVVEPANDEEPVAPPAGWDLSGLSAPCARLLKALKGFDAISEAEFATLAQKENLLVGGAIEAINDWALEKFDEPLIDEGDPIEIAFHLLIENEQDAA